ncbi:MAG TPA: GNAT family N-acetyltransferase [Bacteroidota bacterium]|nr:GNAT family N-acetyltransferase [Bacteroidota bacterium]
MTLARTNSDNKDFRHLTGLLDLERIILYGDVQAQYHPFNVIESLSTVVVAYQDKIPVGCGCFKSMDMKTVEIKRIFVRPEYREKGIARSIMQELERWAHDSGYSTAILETGIKQAAAIQFYSHFGYERIDNYGYYIGNANSLCMSKSLEHKPKEL